jgi:DNA-binding transcriptional MocR family regulator
MTLVNIIRPSQPSSASSESDARRYLATAGRRRVSAGTPKYLGLVEALEAGLSQGALAPGAQLPPQRDLAELFGMTLATVTKAISEAARRGLVIARSGSGTFMASAPEHLAQPSANDLSLNIPPASIAADLVAASLRRVTMRSQAARLIEYAPVGGSAGNRAAGAALFATRGLSAQADHVLLTQGAHQGLIAALAATTRPGDSVACERLNYSGLRRIGELLQLTLVGIDCDEEGMVVGQLRSRLRSRRIAAIVCTPSGHNPTSFTLSEQRRAELVRLARGAAVPVIEDDIYGLLCNDGLPPLAALWPEGTLCVTSLSKSVAPGLRIGYNLCPPALMSRLRDGLFALGWTESSLQAALATELIQSGALTQCVARHQAEARRRVALAHQILPGGCIQTASTTVSYHLWVATSDANPNEVAAELSRRGILVSPSSHFVVDDSQPPDALRVSLGGAASAQGLEAPLKELAAVMRDDRQSSFGSIV